jgi:hypothetical protein
MAIRCERYVECVARDPQNDNWEEGLRKVE